MMKNKQSTNNRLHYLIAITFICLLAGIDATQAAVINLKSQARSVLAQLEISGTPSKSQAKASGFGVFSNTVSFGGGGRYEPYYVTAAQVSALGDTNINATGSASVGLANALVGNANAQSDFQVTFRLLQPVTFSLAGQLVWNEIGTVVVESPWVKLSSGANVIFQTDPAPMDGTPLDYATNAVLQPGDYTLTAHAGVTNDFANGADKGFSLNFSVVPNGSPSGGFGNVYTLLGAIEATYLNNNGVMADATVSGQDLARWALGLPTSSPLNGQTLALVSDSRDHSLRLAVWNPKTSGISLELGPLEPQAALIGSNNFAATLEWTPDDLGRIVSNFGGMPSRLTFATSGRLDPAGTVVQFRGRPAVGQVNLTGLPSGGTNTVLIHGGGLTTGRKLGTTP